MLDNDSTINVSANNKRIAKNAALLYVRMAVVMLLSLYISRIVLKVLGVEDFGIYNVVGGVVALFSYLNSALSAATQRYLNFEMGRNNMGALNKVFCMSINIHLLLAVIVLVFAETIGLWFLNKYIVIPSTRMYAANWVYQLSVITTFITIATIPHSAIITAHEKMSVYAFVSILEVCLKLGVVFLIQYTSNDHLIMYALLLTIITLIVRSVYVVYSLVEYKESKYRYIWDASLFKEMFGFTGWNFMGATAGIAMNQGVNILLNVFFGPIVNASRAIGVQVQQAFMQLSTNFLMAVNPQIVKSYSSGDIERMTNLVVSSSKYAFMIMAVTAMPFLVKMDFVLGVWLVDVPDGAVLFTKLLLIYQLTICLTYSVNMASQASGNVKLFQIVESATLILILPVGWLQLKLGMEPASVFVSMIVLSVIALFLRLMVLKKIINFQVGKYLHRVLVPALIVSVIFSIIYIVSNRFFMEDASIGMSILQMVAVLLVSLLVAYAFGLTKFEKSMLFKVVKQYLVRKK